MADNGNNFLTGALSGSAVLGQARFSLAEQQVRNLQKTAESQAINRVKDSPAKAVDSDKMEKAAADFEALLLQQMFKAMWSTVPKDGMLSGSSEEAIYRDMLNEALAKDIAEGQSIGIKDIILKEFKKSES
ncbi:MAG: hypothetical protein D6719_04880 [Candidatus Dadabacteria bacterium]|nr:MAG: hypothetical protein D6719_04880 [Candidatus Dadabacteria bacterium]